MAYVHGADGRDGWPGALDDPRPEPAAWVLPLPRTHQLCQTLARGLGLDGGAVAMMTDTGERDLVHATDPVSAHLDELQFSLAEGPCVDACTGRVPVLAPDLAALACRVQWPVFAEAASAAGAAATFAFPMMSGGVCFGVLELYRRATGPLDAAALSTVEAGVAALTRVALDEILGSADADGHPHSWPARLTTAHAEVHQAAGMVSVHLRVSVDDAFARLRGAAYSRGTSLTELARGVLTGLTRLD